MKNNYDLLEENELSKKAMGGTELMLRQIHDGTIARELLENFQIIPSRVRDLKLDKIRILCCHDLPDDPESAKFREASFLNNFHRIVFISNWQMQRYQMMHGIPYDTKSVVIESAIESAPVECLNKRKDGRIDICYTSTPQRGLDILISVFEHFAKSDPNIHLHVYSSFKIYGWEDRDAQFQPLYDKCINHPQITYHGFVPNETLRKSLNEYHIFAYPSIWLETSCRSMLEAMSAGLVCVHPNYGALAETSGGLNVMYQGDLLDKQKHAQIFASYLKHAIDGVRTSQFDDPSRFIKMFVDNRFNALNIKQRWEAIMQSLLQEFPTAETRGVPSARFIYNV